MEWTDLMLTIPTKDTEYAADLAREVVPGGVYIEDYSDLEQQVLEIAHIDLIDEDLVKKDRTHSILHLYISPDRNPNEAVSYVSDLFAKHGISYEISTQGVEEEDWGNAWKAHYHPIKIGRRIVVCPSWETYDKKDDEIVLIMDPGMAFGSGTHQTTQLCCSTLEDYVTGDTHLLDMGSGSGILSIASLLLGGKDALGVDIDPTAVRTSKENAVQNHVDDRFNAYCGDITLDKSLSNTVGEGYDVIAANIVADIILYYKDEFKKRLRAGGTLIASGIIEERENEVADALEAIGFKVIDRKHLDGWAALVLTH